MHLDRVSILGSDFPREDVYPFNLEILRKTPELGLTNSVTFFAGENGSGKSTLLKAICRRCGVHIWQETERSRYQYNPYEEELQNYVRVRWTNGEVPGALFSSQIFQDFARFLDEWARSDPGILAYFGGNSLVTQSHGQSLLSFFAARYRYKGIYFLDEPETALSPSSQLKLLALLQEMSADGHAQFIIASHSPLLLACPGATIYSFDEPPVRRIEYRQTAYYRIYKDFMDNPEKYLTGL